MSLLRSLALAVAFVSVARVASGDAAQEEITVFGHQPVTAASELEAACWTSFRRPLCSIGSRCDHSLRFSLPARLRKT